VKVVILAGGAGTRLAEETTVKPKPMVEIGGKPILWHIMKSYAHHGFNEFVVALGYRGDAIKEYFLHYRERASDLSIHLKSGRIEVRHDDMEDWTVHLIDTGLDTQTGGRIARLLDFIGPETFMMTYGDGVASLDVRALLEFHRKAGVLATVTAVRPVARFGALVFDGDLVSEFTEKPQTGEGWINGGFFVLEPGIADYLDGRDDCIWEHGPMERLSADRQLAAWRHDGFWQCMDTLRDVRYLNQRWRDGDAPWKVWS